MRHAEQNDPAIINNYNTVSNQSFVNGKNPVGKPASRIYNSEYISPFPTIGSTPTGDHHSFPLMSLYPLAPASLPHYQFPSDPPISLCISTPMSLPFSQIFCGMPP